jgi:hypothetical protein
MHPKIKSFFLIVLIVGPQDRGDFSRRCVECVGVEKGVKKLRFLLGLPAIKVCSSDVFFLPEADL